MTINYNSEKLSEMVHYIIFNCSSNPNFGKTVLYKLLYFSDFNHYKKNNKSITNEDYRKIEFGPAPVHIAIIINKLEKENKIETKQLSQNTKYKILDIPKLSKLSKEEISTIDKVIKKLGNLSATQISNLSHKDNPYIVSKDKEIIDYDLVFYRAESLEKLVE
ncbi:MAG: Panacea domain-containing protein [Candidatus Pacearchaeota archaeon]|jgi:uncharacterized phage-associated protein